MVEKNDIDKADLITIVINKAQYFNHILTNKSLDKM